ELGAGARIDEDAAASRIGDGHLAQRVELVIGGKLFGGRVEIEDIARIERLAVVAGQGFAAGHSVVTDLAVEPIVAPTAEDDVVGGRQREYGGRVVIQIEGYGENG